MQIMKNLLAVFVLTLISLPLLAQQDDDKVVIKEEKRIVVEDIETDGNDEKVISVDVEKEGDDERKIKIKISNNGEEVEFEWDGEGEMPEDMKKMLEEHDIDIDDLHEQHKDGKVKVKVKSKGDKGLHKRHMKREMHRDHQRAERHERRLRHGPRLGDAYIGAQIESADGGVRILDVMAESPSHKAGLKKGDIVTEINGANTKSMEDMLILLSFFDPTDQIEIAYKRDGNERKTKVTLAKRPESYR